ncbi:MAG: DUF1874 domain-containing protein [Sporomusaceae bacterium]|nr:DUF1874 domain-containing protein [Sporomusaceae bacterium]
MDIYPVAILNGAIITEDGEYSCRTISLAEARQRMHAAPAIISAVGHAATAEILSDLLAMAVAFNRIDFRQQAGQSALIFKLNRRPPEGIILSRAEIEAFGYQFQWLTRHS